MTSYPAGLSTDSLELNLASASSPPPTQEDQWSDAHDTIETDDERDVIEEVEENPEDLTVQGPKVSSDKTHTHEIETPSPTNLDSNNAQERASDADATSVHSMPVVQVTEPTSPTTLPATPRSASSHQPSTAAPRSTSSLAPSAHPNQDRRRRHRTTLDVSALCSSAPRDVHLT